MINRSSIETAAARVAPFVRRTPVITVTVPLPSGEAPVVLKLELLQHTGSFKPRGAFNRMLRAGIPASGFIPASGIIPASGFIPASGVITPPGVITPSGVITASGGNHGAAVAFAAQTLGHRAEIFVPSTTPQTKIDRITGYAARVFQGGEAYADALMACRARQAETGALEVHAYDHPDVLSGQGTVGREFEHDAPDLTHILVATGGGGLIGGIAAWYESRAAVISVEPETCATLHAALRAGHPVDCPVSGLAADALGARRVGEAMFPIAQRHVAAALLVTDAAIAAAQWFLWDRLRLIAEPGGATALAALLSGRFVPPHDARIGVVICGANTDPQTIVTP